MRKYFFTFFLICYGISNSFAVPTTLDYGYAENNPLYFGNPSDANDDEITNECNFLLEKQGYTVSYNNNTLCPNWVAWHLTKDDLGESTRSDKFISDKSLPQKWYAVKKMTINFQLMVLTAVTSVPLQTEPRAMK